MKKIATLMLFFAFSLVYGKTDIEKKGLKGKVKSFKQYRIKENFGEITKNTLEIQYLFNQNGDLIENKEFFFNGSLRNQYLYKYNQKGFLIEEIYESHSQGFNGYNARDKTIYKYDEKDNLIEANTEGTFNYKYLYKYDENKNRIEEDEYNSSRNLHTLKYFKYDKQNNLIEINEPSSYNKKKTIFLYDKQNNLIEKAEYESGGILLKKENYILNTKNLVVEWVDENNNSLSNLKIYKYKSKYKYDEKGNVAEKLYYSSSLTNSDSFLWKELYQYDEKNNLIECLHFDEKNFLNYDFLSNINEIEYYE